MYFYAIESNIPKRFVQKEITSCDCRFISLKADQ